MKKMLLNSKSGSLWAQLAVFVAAILMTAQVKAENVAQIVEGGSYATVQSAINAAQSGQTVKMLANSTENITVTPGKMLTLDLNGKLLQGTGSGSVITVQAEGSLTFSDSGEEANSLTFNADKSWTWNNGIAADVIAKQGLKVRPVAGAVVAFNGSTVFGGSGEIHFAKVFDNCKFGNKNASIATVSGLDFVKKGTDPRRVKAAAALNNDNPLPGNDATSNSMKYYRTQDEGAYSSDFYGYYHYDVEGIHNNNVIPTSYQGWGSTPMGYIGMISIEGSTYIMSIENLGQVYEYGGIQVKQNLSMIDNGQAVKFCYTLRNNTTGVKTVTIANFTDVKIGDNDNATVYLTGGGQKISMTDTHSPGECGGNSAGLEYTIKADEDTPFTGAWIGKWNDADDNVFSSQPDSKYVGDDSGCAFHWTKTLNPGQTTTVICYFQIAPALVIKAVNLIADAENAQVHFDIPYKDFPGRTQTLYYTLEGQPQATHGGTTVGKTADDEGFAHTSFTFSADVTSWPSNTMRTIDLYATDNMGYISKYYTFNVLWPEWSPDENYSIVSFLNTVDLFANVRGKIGDVIVLPSDKSVAGVKEFHGWNTKEDGTGTSYNAGDNFTIPENDTELYAQWKTGVNNLTIIAEDQDYTGKPIETVIVKDGTTVLTPGVDYTIVYESNVNTGEAKATIKGDKILGEKVIYFNINKRYLDDIVLPDQPYTGGHQLANITDNELYTVTTNVGGTAITPSGELGYPVVLTLRDLTKCVWKNGNQAEASRTIYFKIVGAKVDDPVINDKPYTGQPQTADVPASTLYTVEENIGGTDMGTYTVKLKLVDYPNFSWTECTGDTRILEWHITKIPVTVPTIADKVYNGETQKADVTETERYTVVENNGGTNVGSYFVKLKLKEPTGYKWTDSDDETIQIDYNITPATNSWTITPSINDIFEGQEIVPVYEAAFGTDKTVITYTGFDGTVYPTSTTKPTAMGKYKARFVITDANYTTLSKYVDFKIKEAACMIGSTIYSSLDDAVDAVKPNESIKLLKDQTIEAGKTITLPLGANFDLNGKTLTNNGTIQFDLTGTTENKYKVISGKTPLTAADCGNVVAVNTPEGKTFVPVILDNELFFVNKGTLDLGTFDWNTFTFKDATGTEGLTYSQFMIMLTKEIDLNKVIAHHTLELPNVAGYTKNASLSSEYTYVIDLATPATAKQIAEYVKQVKFRNITTDQQVRVVIGDKTDVKTFYFSGTQHYYQYVKFTTIKSWTDAYNEAKTKTFANRQGYLATIMNKEEDVFIYKAASEVGWIGATRLKPEGSKVGMYYNGFKTNETYDYWYWACGPECDKVFFSKAVAGNTNYETEKNKGYYFNWNNASYGEPNNSSPGENCATTLRFGSGYSTGASSIIGYGYSWNDIPYNRDLGATDYNEYSPRGYFVEFGDLPIGDSSNSGSAIAIDCSIVAEKAITPRTLTGITADNYSGKYDGLYHSFALNGKVDTDVLEYSADGTNYSTNVASAGLKDVCTAVTSYIRVTREGYYVKPYSGTVTITKRDVTLTSGDATQYGHLTTPLQCKQVTEGGDGFVAGEGATYDNFASQLGLGSCDNTFDYTLKSNTKAINYNITKFYGTLTVKGVCRIGDDYYDTIDLAIEAVKPGETIVLLTDITMENSLQLPAGTGLDLDGFTLTNPTGLDLSWDLTEDVAPVVFDFDDLAANGTLTLKVNDQQTYNNYVIAQDAPGATGKEFILKGADTADGANFRALTVGTENLFYGHRFYSLVLDGSDIVLTVKKVKPQNFEFWGVSVDGNQLALTSDVNYNAKHVRDDFYPADAITHFIYDGDITRIGRYCLENNLNLKEVYFPEVTDYVSLNAFNGCENLEYVSTGEGLVEINDRAFHGCTKLNTIDIADNAELKEIAEEAFAGTGFVTMTLPASVEYIGSRTFFGAKNLESVTLCGTDPSKINMTHESFKKDNDGTLPAASIFVVSDKLLPFEAYYYGKGINFQTKYERVKAATGIYQIGFFSHHNFIVPEGLEAYAATWDGRSFVLSTTTATAGEVLEGGHGYIFTGAEGTYTFETTAKEPTFTFAANDLIGSPEEVTAKDPLKLGRVFVVENGNYSIFNEVTDPAVKIAACQPFAIITPNNAPAVKYFDFDMWYNGWATGVQSPSESTANSDEPTYNVAGQRISSSYKGIVIQNGKKQLNK